MKFPVGSLISTLKFPLQVVEVLGYTEDGTQFFVNIRRDGFGDIYIDKELDVALEFRESEWTFVTDLTKALV